ncbi:MAG TPA: hypothetical protein VHM92_06555 [Allosphingosinicella sp.]|nr:hypothetical protein [Allosphingosinicella sp.]
MNKIVLFLVVAAAGAQSSAAAPAAANPRTLPTYDWALRCTALILATRKGPKDRSRKAAVSFDAALYWGLATGDLAKQAGRSSDAMEADVDVAKARAKGEMKRGGKARDSARRELRKCMADVPPLDP